MLNIHDKDPCNGVEEVTPNTALKMLRMFKHTYTTELANPDRA
jgi:hypothetical protein